MGGEQSGTRKHLLFYVALLICLAVSGCASTDGWLSKKGPPKAQEGPEEHLARAQTMLAQRSYESALQEYETVISLSGGKPPEDKALFYIGQIYGDPQNPKKDFPKAIAAFQRLTNEYGQGAWADSARVWMENLKEQERLKRVMFESLQESERLRKLWNEALQDNDRLKRLLGESSQENAKLKRIVEESKTVDVEIDEKKRNQGK